jgi:hypothetical protein
MRAKLVIADKGVRVMQGKVDLTLGANSIIYLLEPYNDDQKSIDGHKRLWWACHIHKNIASGDVVLFFPVIYENVSTMPFDDLYDVDLGHRFPTHMGLQDSEIISTSAKRKITV